MPAEMNDTSDLPPGETLETLSRGLTLLQAFGAGRPSMSIAEAAEVLDVSRAAARRFLLTLEAKGLVVRRRNEFRLTPRVLELGYGYFASLHLPTAARPILAELTEETGETSGLFILHGDDAMLLTSCRSTRHYSPSNVPGTAFPAFATAAGRVLLAWKPQAEIDDFLARLTLTAFTPYTVRSKKALAAELENVRQTGSAVAAHELAFGFCGLAEPVTNAAGEVVAAVNIGLQVGADPQAMAELCRPALARAIAQINRVVSEIPPYRQTLLFSATMPPEVEALARKYLRKPVVVQVGVRAAAASTVTHAVYPVPREKKNALLVELLTGKVHESVLVFTRTKHGADRVVRDLEKAGVRATAMHADKSQSQRTRALQDFKDGKTHVLVATDIAQRGLDIENISHVINYDVPQQAEDYVHRIGRTGRAAKEGDAYTFMAPDEIAMVRTIERVIGQPIPRVSVPGYDFGTVAAD